MFSFVLCNAASLPLPDLVVVSVFWIFCSVINGIPSYTSLEIGSNGFTYLLLRVLNYFFGLSLFSRYRRRIVFSIPLHQMESMFNRAVL